MTSHRPLRAVHVSFYSDSERRAPEELLQAWPTLVRVPGAVARAGVEAIVVQAAATRQTLRRDGVTFHFVEDRRGISTHLPGCLPAVHLRTRLIERVASLMPDVLHVHGFAFPLAIWQLTRTLPDVPVLVQDHASRPPAGLRRAVWRAANRTIAAAAFTARAQAEPFVEAGVLSPTLPVVEVLESSSTFTPGDQQSARRRTGLSGDPCVLWTGHLDRNKDPLTTLDAFERAAPALRDARLWCCFGQAPLLEAVRYRIDASAVLRERVILLGTRPHAEMEAYFRAADFFVQTSHREGCSFSILEALACGTPPLVTDIPSSRRLVGSAGSLTPVRDSRALAGALVTWAARDPARGRRDARAWFHESLTFDRIGAALSAAYVTLASGR